MECPRAGNGINRRVLWQILLNSKKNWNINTVESSDSVLNKNENGDGIFAVFILSTAFAVLHFMYSIQSSSSISPVSISSSVSFMKEMSLSMSQSVLELLPSIVSSSDFLWFSFHLLYWTVFFLFFFALDDEAKHFTLSRSYHSFMFSW